MKVDDHLRERGLVWHYTTLGALQQILESKSFLATEVSYQNDPLETETADAVLFQALDELACDSRYKKFTEAAKEWRQGSIARSNASGDLARDLFSSARFLFCASSDPDSLYAWRTYSASSRAGCAIGIDPASPLGVVGNAKPMRPTRVSPWTQVDYTSTGVVERAKARLREIGDKWVEDASASDYPYRSDSLRLWLLEFDPLLDDLTTRVKHSSYVEERESRLTVTGAEHAVMFTPGDTGPRPRIRLASARHWSTPVDEPSARLPIKAIVLSPTAPGQARKTIQWLLFANGYPLDVEFEVEEVEVQRADGTTETGIHPVPFTDNVVDIYDSEHAYRIV